MERNGENLRIDFHGNKLELELDEIKYFEGRATRVFATMMDEHQISFEGNLDDLWEMLDGTHFIRCHQNYLVSCKAIAAIYPAHILLDNRLIAISPYYHELICRRVDELQMWLRQRRSRAEWGILQGISGTYEGTLIPIRRDEDVVIGRDPEEADVIFETPEISRKHCSISYLGPEEGFLIADFSTNGTYVLGGDELHEGIPVQVPVGSRISLSDGKAVFVLV